LLQLIFMLSKTAGFEKQLQQALICIEQHSE
jgi:hypothetical protein